MKFKINIECSATEARQFLGLPEIEEFQRTMLEEVQKRTTEYVNSIEPDKLVKMWMPTGTEAVETMQKTFAQFTAAATGAGKKGKKPR